MVISLAGHLREYQQGNIFAILNEGGLLTAFAHLFDDGWQCLYYSIFDSCNRELAKNLMQQGFADDVTLRGYYKVGFEQYTDVRWFSVRRSDWQR